MKKIILVLFLCIFSFNLAAKSSSSSIKSEQEPYFTMGFNAGNLISYGIGSAIMSLGPSGKLDQNGGIVFLPFQITSNHLFSSIAQLSWSIIHRWESYYGDNANSRPAASSDSIGRVKYSWNNSHELYFLAGPRISLTNSGLKGWYFSLLMGAGFTAGPSWSDPSFKEVTLTFSPNIGYSFIWGTPGVYLDVGAGALISRAVYRDPEIDTCPACMLGQVIHGLSPMINITLGFAL